MKEWLWIPALLTLASIFLPLGSLSHGKKAARPRSPRRGVLLVAFGTTVLSAQKAYDLVESLIRKAFPGIEIQWAFTSKTVRGKLAAAGRVVSSPETAMARMMDEGFTHLAVLSLHVIPGREFHDLRRNVELFERMAGGFERVLTAWPLLSSRDDMVRVAKGLLAHLPLERRAEEAVVFVGHGTEKHPADAIYAAMHLIFQELDPNAFVGTVQGYPSMEDVLTMLCRKGIRKAYLIPFMAVAGDHVRNDMAGDKPDSWKSVFTAKGITCEAVRTGMAEHPEIVEVWLDHLREVTHRLTGEGEDAWSR